MTVKSYKKGVFNLNDEFYDEIPANDVENRKDPTLKEKRKINIIIIILFIISLLLLLFSIYYAFFMPKKYINYKTIKDGDIAVIHSKIDFGTTINSFSTYTSENKANEYKFYIMNDNNHELNYNIYITTEVLNEVNIPMIDKTMISYALYKNNKKVASGTLKDITSNHLVKEVTKDNNKDTYVLKLWSNSGANKGYKYRIEVLP